MSTEQNTIGHEEGGDRQRAARRSGRAKRGAPRSRPLAVRAASAAGGAGGDAGPRAIDSAAQPADAKGALALVPSPAQRPVQGLDEAPCSATGELQHARRLLTAAEAVRVFPFAGISGAGANGHVGVSREAVQDHLEGREACLLEAFEHVLTLAVARASAAYDAQQDWADRVRAGLVALLEFFDEERAVARYLVVHSAQAGPAVLARRQQVLDRLARVLDDERAPARSYPPPLTAQAIVSGVLGVLHERLSKPAPGSLVDLAGPLMSFIVLPFLGARAARRELARPTGAFVPVGPSAALEVLQRPAKRGNQRIVEVLRVIAREPGLNNKEVGLRAGVKSQAQISKIVLRLAQRGLIESTPDPRIPGPANAWRLTASGQRVHGAVGRDAPRQPSVAFDLPEEFAGRLDHRAVLVLRTIADQPWLSNREVAVRAGLDAAQISHVLASLVRLGLAANMRDPQRSGAPNEWRLTASGEKLDRHLGRETPAPPRSLALDLMRASGGRLKPRAASALRVIGAEPGLSNLAVAARVGVKAAIHISHLLARLAERGLIENTRTQGSENAWQLTVSGVELERAIRQETPAPVERRMALDLLKERGGHLNHRAVSLLRVIAANPGLSNKDIALRVGIESKGAASTVLARLARLGLIENTRRGGRENEWQLTASGREIERATRHENPAAGLSAKHDTSYGQPA